MQNEEIKIKHIVQKGENLSELTKYYTGGYNYNSVAKNNGISDPNTIHVGQEIEFSVSKESAYAQANPAIYEQETSTVTTNEPVIENNIASETMDNSANPANVDINNATTEPTSNTNSSISSSTVAPAAINANNSQSNSNSIAANSNNRSFSNKWLCSTCPTANTFSVDKTHTDYYIGYYDSKKLVSSINDAWQTVKDSVSSLKNDIETLKKSIDSADYKQRTKDVINAIDGAIDNLNNNFTSLFNAVVNRLIEAAATDEWFSETAIEYATFISETILGKPIPNNNSATQSATQTDTPSPAAEPQINTESVENVEPVVSEANTISNGNARVSNEEASSKLGITAEQLDVVKATIRHEAGNNPKEMLAVASVIKNRMDSGVWGGTDAYSVTTAKGQFESYLKGYYKQYTNGNYYQGGTAEEVADVSEQINAILTGNAEPITNAERFRSGYKEGREQYTPGGNYYF